MRAVTTWPLLAAALLLHACAVGTVTDEVGRPSTPADVVAVPDRTTPPSDVPAPSTDVLADRSAPPVEDVRDVAPPPEDDAVAPEDVALAADASRCSGAQIECGGVCVDTQSDLANCGACGAACPAGQRCTRGACACPGAGMVCSGACVDTTRDSANCGACGNACATGATCTAGACVSPPPPNDTCASPTVIDMSRPSQTLSVATTMARAGAEMAAPCATGTGADVFYRFRLTAREIVYADSFASDFDTVLYLATSCTTPVTTATNPAEAFCDDNGAGGCAGAGTTSRIAMTLAAGTYYLVAAGAGGASGTLRVRFEHLPVGTGPVQPLPAGATTQTGTTSGTGGIEGGCEAGLGGSGPEVSYWWGSCPADAGGAVTANTCTATTWDTVVYLRNANAGVGNACSDDSCGTRSQLSGTVASGAGLHVLTVDGYGTAAGSYSLAVTRP